MTNSSDDNRFQNLLHPLHEAGWLIIAPSGYLDHASHSAKVWHIGLRRSCMVVGVQLDPESRRSEVLTFVPIAARLKHPDDGIGSFDAVNRPVTLGASAHSLAPPFVESFVSDLGLLDPTRYRLPEELSREQRADFLFNLYTNYVGRAAARWRGGSTLKTLRALDADERFSDLLKTAMSLAPGVVPDPVPMAAAMGITLACWRHTELESAHASRKPMTDVAMARMSIGTTRAVRDYITTDGIDWDGVGGVLFDPERQFFNDNGDSVGQLVGDDWPRVAASIQENLDDWMHAEQIAGPEATLRLASMMGSTTYTKRWWGNGWWAKYSGDVLDHVLDEFPELLPRETDLGEEIDYRTSLRDWPEEMPDDELSVLIDPPDGNGLRFGALPEIKSHLLAVTAPSESRYRRAA